MGRIRSFWKRVVASRIPVDLVGLPLLGAVAFFLFRHASALSPIEGALLVMAAAGLLLAGVHWWNWQRGLMSDGVLKDWLHRILEGERRPINIPEGLRDRDQRVAAALNAVIEDVQSQRAKLAGLKQAMACDWRELDALLEAVQRHHGAEAEARLRGTARLESLGRELKTAIEDTLQLDQVELNYRLRADHFRLHGQVYRSTLEQLRTELDQFENLLEELQSSFPRLRREEEALGRLADAGLRQGERLVLSVKGLVSHSPRLVNGAQARTEGLRRLRETADGVRDQTEALIRRIEGFRDEAQGRIRSFGGAQGSLKDLAQVAKQTGLLAVNAAILAQQDGGSGGMAAIGGRLRFLADQTSEGTKGMERTLDEYQRGLERETASLWDLQEVTQKLLSEVQDLLRTAGLLDHQGHDLEQALETHLGLVDQVRQSSERAELSLHEVGARSLALEAAHGRQWGVEAKLTPERERLSRMGLRLVETGNELALISQQNIDEISEILVRHQEIRRTDAYRQVVAGELPRLLEGLHGAELAWNGMAWARAQRRSRLAGSREEALPPLGRHDSEAGLRLLLLTQDALSRPEPSALEAWSCDATGQVWNFQLLAPLRTESLRLGLLALLKESPLAASFPGLDLRIAPEGARLKLPHPYPGLPGFLAGLRLELPVEPDLWDLPFREGPASTVAVQRLLWLGPSQGGGLQSQGLRLAHAWMRDRPYHECFLPWLPYPGQRPRCPWFGNIQEEKRLSSPLPVRCLGLGADPAGLHPFRDRLLRAGAIEGPGGMTLCAVGIGHPHPEALLLGLFQPDGELAGAFHPDLVPYQIRFREEVLGGGAEDPYRAAWAILEDLQGEGWLMPLPSETA